MPNSIAAGDDPFQPKETGSEFLHRTEVGVLGLATTPNRVVAEKLPGLLCAVP